MIMEKLERLLDLLIVIAENQVKGIGMMVAATGETELEKAERKVRKTRAPKTEEKAPEAPAPKVEEKIEDQLGLGPDPSPKAPEEKKEMTEKESLAAIDAVTKRFIVATKNEKPEDGKTRAIRMLNTDPRFGVGKLGDLTHAQRLMWIAEMEKGIIGVK